MSTHSSLTRPSQKKAARSTHGTFCELNFTRCPQATADAEPKSHLNSIDKDANGDYLISAREMSCVYKISGRDGSIIWQLGGRSSSFTLEKGSHFAHQHDARFLESTPDRTVISMLNNEAALSGEAGNFSAAQTITLDTTNMTARQTQKIKRPDGLTTKLRGNFQKLDNGNSVVGWSENGVVSEHDPSGELVLQASFASQRFVTYRAYKFQWTGAPSEPPALVVLGYDGEGSQQGAVTTAHVSWNGATEVDRWRFYSSEEVDGPYTLRCDKRREGFETSCVMPCDARRTYAKAVSASGEVLVTTEVVQRSVKGNRPPGLTSNDVTDEGAFLALTSPSSWIRAQQGVESVPVPGSSTIFMLLGAFTIGYMTAKRRRR